MQNNSVEYEILTLEDVLYVKDTAILKYTVQYPQFASVRFRRAVQRMNEYYRRKAILFEQYCRRKLFPQAVEDFHHSKENGYPVHQYEAILKPEITWNKDCAVSLYFDRYEYTGGAHGQTIRSSDTWALQTGTKRTLQSFFPRGFPYRDYILRLVNAEIERQMESGEGYYFDDYQKNTADTFDPEQFYLKPEGIVIYYQQYDIAPYSSGIPEFLIPFTPKIVRPPRC